MKSPNRFYVRLLGGFELARDDGVEGPIRLSTKKVCALVAFVAMSRKQSASREELATLLWGSCSDQQARQSLRQALVLLRKDLGSPNVLYADKETIRLEPGVWSVDALDFERLADSAKLEDLERAVALYGGEFLAGVTIEEEGFDEWLRTQRDRIRMAAGRALATYAERSDAARNGPQAIAAVERLLTVDPLREDWQRLALLLIARYRGQYDALAQAKQLEALLRQELDVDPEPATKALIEAIRRGDIGRVAVPAGGDLSVAQIDTAAKTPSPPEPIPVHSSLSPAAAAVQRRRPWRRLGRTGGIAIAVATVVLIGIGLTYGHSIWLRIGDAAPGKSANATEPPHDPWQSPALPSQRSAAQPAQRSAVLAVAVLPFTSYGMEGDAAHMIAEMMTDDLTNSLSRMLDFRVISRQTSRSYKGQTIDAASIGAELGVRYILEGSVQLRGDKLRVNVELTDAASRLQAWSGMIERDGTDRYAIQDEIVRRIGREFQLKVIQVESDRPSNDPGLEKLLFKAWAEYYTVVGSRLEVLKRAQSYFTEVLERDPVSYSALTGLAATYLAMTEQFLVDDRDAHMTKVEDYLRRVAAIKGDYPHWIAGRLHKLRGNLDDAVKSFERSLEINPSNASSYAHLGHTLLRMGRAGEGIEYIRYAMRLSPKDQILSGWLRNAGEAELELGHYGEAIEYFRHSDALQPRHRRTLLVFAAGHALAGNMSEAQARLSELKKVAPQLSEQQLIERFVGDDELRQPRLREGLRLMLPH